MSEYRLNKEDLLKTMVDWNGFLKKKVHLIACGGTAMTLLGVKESTRDVDFLVPVAEEYRYLVKTLQDLGYVSASGHGWKRPAEMIISKLFRSTRIDVQDCLALVRSRKAEIDINILKERFKETAQYDITEDRTLGYWDHFEGILAKEGLYGQ